MKKLFVHRADTPGATSFAVYQSRSKRGPVAVRASGNIVDNSTGRCWQSDPAYISQGLWDAIHSGLLSDDAPDDMYRVGLEALGFITAGGLPEWMHGLGLELPAPEDPGAFVEWITAAWQDFCRQFEDGQ